MSTEENKRNVVRWREEIWNNRNLNVLDELAAPEYVCHLGGEQSFECLRARQPGRLRHPCDARVPDRRWRSSAGGCRNR
jgi:hypothetical protein